MMSLSSTCVVPSIWATIAGGGEGMSEAGMRGDRNIGHQMSVHVFDRQNNTNENVSESVEWRGRKGEGRGVTSCSHGTLCGCGLSA